MIAGSIAFGRVVNGTYQITRVFATAGARLAIRVGECSVRPQSIRRLSCSSCSRQAHSRWLLNSPPTLKCIPPDRPGPRPQARASPNRVPSPHPRGRPTIWSPEPQNLNPGGYYTNAVISTKIRNDLPEGPNSIGRVSFGVKLLVRFSSGETLQNTTFSTRKKPSKTKKSWIIVWGLFSLGETLQNTTFGKNQKRKRV